jgi:4-diphosphocytidyl-2-C-methyl-D-erythritol kinase
LLSQPIKLPAFAKINLGLRVLDKRADGYHELDTIFQTVSLHDTLNLLPADDSQIIFSCDDRTLPTDAQNLVVRAARALQQRFAPAKGACIRLEKKIPARAGLGGGSSDAAVALMGMVRLWQLNPSVEELKQIAAKLGADVPFFLHGGTARGTGIGDRLEPLPDAPEAFLLIIKPNAHISTADAYKRLDERALTSQNSKTILSRSAAQKVFDISSFASLQNDFEAIAFGLETEIERAKAALLRAGAGGALLAGSGSAVFGVFDSEDAQRRAIQAIELEAGWRVFPCRTVGRSEYEAAMPLGLKPVFARTR